jgi:hypothetical protein
LQYVSLLKLLPQIFHTFDNVWNIHILPEGIYFRGTTGVYRWNGREMKVWGLSSFVHRSYSVRQKVLIRQESMGLYEIQNDSLTLVPNQPDYLKEEIIYDVLAEGETDWLLFGQKSGLIRFDGKQYHILKTALPALTLGEMVVSCRITPTHAGYCKYRLKIYSNSIGLRKLRELNP